MLSKAFFISDLGTEAAMMMCNNDSDERGIIVNCFGMQAYSNITTSNNTIGRKDYYFMYVVKGSVSLFTPQNTEIKAGSIMILPPNTPYSYKNNTVGTSYFWIHFTGNEAEELLRECNMYETPFICKVKGNNNIFEFYEKMSECMISKMAFSQRRISVYLQRMILDIADTIIPSDERISPLSDSLQYINNNYSIPISVETLAEIEHLSISRYNSIFKELIGDPPLHYIIKIRINNACRLLEETNMTINAIGESVGYSDCHYFSRIFKLYTNMSPLKYRKLSNSNK